MLVFLFIFADCDLRMAFLYIVTSVFIAKQIKIEVLYLTICLSDNQLFVLLLNKFLHNLTTSRAVFVNDLSSLACSFSAILRILVEFSGSFGRKAFLLRLSAQ